MLICSSRLVAAPTVTMIHIHHSSHICASLERLSPTSIEVVGVMVLVIAEAATYTIIANLAYTAGRLVWGYASDRLGRRRSYIIYNTGQAILFALAPASLQVVTSLYNDDE
jgi:MFS family permease